MNKQKLQNSAMSAAFVGAGIVGERLLSKGVDKAVEKFAPQLKANAMYEWARPVATAAVGIAAALFAKGEHADKIQQVGIGMAGSSVFAIANKASKGTLSGTLGFVEEANYTSPYIGLPTLPVVHSASSYTPLPSSVSVSENVY